jgi:hypothetical protein
MIYERSAVTVRQAVTMAARVLSVFFLFWAIFNLTELPTYIVAFVHYGRESVPSAAESVYHYWISRYAGYIAVALIRSAVELWLARWFYRCRPAVERLLLGEEIVADAQVLYE